jgi:hypothetical protein
MPNFYNRIKARKFTSVSDTAVEISAYNSATPNFTIDAGGKLNWSSGSAVADTNLYRSTPNTLRTDDSFDIASGQTYQINGANVLTATSLGSSVVGSSLTSVGSLTGLTAATPNFSGPLTSAGISTFQNTLVLQQSLEKVTAGGNLTGTTNIDLLTSALYSYTSTGDFTLNFRGSSSTSLNTLMSDNQSITAAIFVTNTTARSLSAIQIQGTTSGVTTRWFGGSAPSGNASSTDVYAITIIKTGSATYTQVNLSLLKEI